MLIYLRLKNHDVDNLLSNGSVSSVCTLSSFYHLSIYLSSIYHLSIIYHLSNLCIYHLSYIYLSIYLSIIYHLYRNHQCVKMLTIGEYK